MEIVSRRSHVTTYLMPEGVEHSLYFPNSVVDAPL